MVRLVLGARLVVQHLQSFAVFDGPIQERGHALLQAADQCGLPALEEHAMARAGVMDFGLPVLVPNGL